MKKMNPEFERKVLLDVVKQIQNPDETMKKQTGIRKMLKAVGTAGFIIAVFVALEDLTFDMVPTFIAALSGCSIGIAFLLDLMQKQWPVTVDHVDMHSVQTRLQELESLLDGV
jgi:hypothetical protein